MTDEEIAKKDYNRYLKIKDKIKDREDRTFLIDFLLNEGYKKGLAEGRKEKWHDLRECPTDSPEKSGEYWCKWEDGTYCTAHYFADNGFGSYVIAWCETPKFEG